MKSVLVIGYGNTLRQDDGVGIAVANRLRCFPGVEVQTCLQLLPELAARLICCERVIFVDARIDSCSLQVQKVQPSISKPALAHFGDPNWLLGLTLLAYGVCPDAVLVTIPITDVEFGEGFSPQMEQTIDRAVNLINSIICTGES
jgi:hydrogenase maturation protease